jgi:DNA-directed RNA polymerase specialized sigma24 family protein
VTQRIHWQLTPDAWNSFLAVLDGDPSRAGEKYEALRGKLITFFRQRQCTAPEDLADESLNRVIRKSQEEPILNLPAFVLGVARRVASETYRSDRIEPLEVEPAIAPADPEKDPAVAQLSDCMDECIAHLFPQERELILEYYGHEKSDKIKTKKEMSGNLGISATALRVRAFRIRKQIEGCVAVCMERARDR